MIAVLWQGIGTAIVGVSVAPQLSTFTTFTAFLIAAIISTIGYLVVRNKRQRSLNVDDSELAEQSVGAHGSRPSQAVKIAVGLNLFTAGAFCLFYISTTLIQPTAASVIETGIGPFVVAVVVAIAAKRFNATLVPTFLIVVLALVFFFVGDVSANAQTYAGFALAVGAGISAVGVLYSSRWASEQDLGVVTIAAIRFHLAWILSGAVAFFSMDLALIEGNLLRLIVISTLCITFPILLLQWGIILAPAFISALIIAVLPAVVMATEIAMDQQSILCNCYCWLSLW